MSPAVVVEKTFRLGQQQGPTSRLVVPPSFGYFIHRKWTSIYFYSSMNKKRNRKRENYPSGFLCVFMWKKEEEEEET
jgi:hypothetical protein